MGRWHRSIKVRHIAIVCALVLVLGWGVFAPAGAVDVTRPCVRPPDTQILERRPIPAQQPILEQHYPGRAEEISDWSIGFDLAGYPYDDGFRPKEMLEVRRLGEAETGDGPLLVMDAGALQVDPAHFSGIGDSVSLHFLPDDKAVDDLDDSNKTVVVDAYVMTHPTYEVGSLTGVRFTLIGETVVTWGDFETAYVTDGASGGFIAEGAVPASDRVGPALFLEYHYDRHGLYCVALSEEGTIDAMVFTNTVGDGVFPLSAGYNRYGRLVSVMIWHFGAPWRWAVPEGQPPFAVTEREAQMAECLAGTREVDKWGYCSAE